MTISRRELLRNALGLALVGCAREAPEGEGRTARSDTLGTPDVAYPPPPTPEDERRLLSWGNTLRQEGLVGRPDSRPGPAAVRVGELAVGTPYVPYTLEEYLKEGGSPLVEPLILHLDRFDCVTLVESCLAIARMAHAGEPSWPAFAREVERMRYRGGIREGFASRLHYFSEWLTDNERRGLVRLRGQELGGEPDTRPLRFMSMHPESYPALANANVLAEIEEVERSLDGSPRYVIPTASISSVADRIDHGDILAFATSIEGLDVTHSAYAYRDDDGVMRVLHAPLSGGVVEIKQNTLAEYVAAIRRATGILVAQPLWR